MERDLAVISSKPAELRFSAHFQGSGLDVVRGMLKFAPTAGVSIAVHTVSSQSQPFGGAYARRWGFGQGGFMGMKPSSVSSH